MKSKRWIKLYTGLLVLVLVTMCMLWHLHTRALPTTRDYPEIQKEGVLRLVTEYNQSGYYIAGDTIEGFQYELSQAISTISGLEIQTHLEMNLTESFEALEKGQYDVIARNIPITSDVKSQYLFTEPLILNKQVLVQRTAKANDGKKPLRNQLELGGKTLHISQNSPALLRISNLEHEIGDTIYIVEEPRYADEQLAILVAKGDIDYAVCDQQIALLSQKQLPELDIETDISFTQLQSWAVRKTSPILLDSLNSWFRRIREEGTFEAIYRKYYTESDN